MLTIHTAPSLRSRPGGAVIADGAVVVVGGRIEAVGPLTELAESHPRARLRRWPGTLGPALVHQAPVPSAPSPRERIHAVLRLGATAVLAEYVTDPALRDAARRSGVIVLPRPETPVLTPAARADLAVLDDAGRCVVTVLGGRVVHRRT